MASPTASPEALCGGRRAAAHGGWPRQVGRGATSEALLSGEEQGRQLAMEGHRTVFPLGRDWTDRICVLVFG